MREERRSDSVYIIDHRLSKQESRDPRFRFVGVLQPIIIAPRRTTVGQVSVCRRVNLSPIKVGFDEGEEGETRLEGRSYLDPLTRGKTQQARTLGGFVAGFVVVRKLVSGS